MLKKIFDGWQTWLWLFAAIFFESSQPYISAACIFVFGFTLSRDFYIKKYAKKIDFLVWSYSRTLNEIRSSNPNVARLIKQGIEKVDLDKANPKAQRKFNKEQYSNSKLLERIIAESEDFDEINP